MFIPASHRCIVDDNRHEGFDLSHWQGFEFEATIDFCESLRSLTRVLSAVRGTLISST